MKLLALVLALPSWACMSTHSGASMIALPEPYTLQLPRGGLVTIAVEKVASVWPEYTYVHGTIENSSEMPIRAQILFGFYVGQRPDRINLAEESSQAVTPGTQVRFKSIVILDPGSPRFPPGTEIRFDEVEVQESQQGRIAPGGGPKK